MNICNNINTLIHQSKGKPDTLTRSHSSVRDQPAKLLLGSGFNIRYVKAIDPKARLISVIESRVVAILVPRHDKIARISINQALQLASRVDRSLSDNNYDIQVAQKRKLPPTIKCIVPVMSETTEDSTR